MAQRRRKRPSPDGRREALGYARVLASVFRGERRGKSLDDAAELIDEEVKPKKNRPPSQTEALQARTMPRP